MNKTSLLISLVLLGVSAFYFWFSPYEYAFFPGCPFRKYGGIHCVGCGMQRALHHLLHGEVLLSLRSNLFLPFFLGIALDYAHAAQKGRQALLDKPWFPWLFLWLALGFMLLRNLPFVPFTYLAPA